MFADVTKSQESSSTTNSASSSGRNVATASINLSRLVTSAQATSSQQQHVTLVATASTPPPAVASGSSSTSCIITIKQESHALPAAATATVVAATNVENAIVGSFVDSTTAFLSPHSPASSSQMVNPNLVQSTTVIATGGGDSLSNYPILICLSLSLSLKQLCRYICKFLFSLLFFRQFSGFSVLYLLRCHFLCEYYFQKLLLLVHILSRRKQDHKFTLLIVSYGHIQVPTQIPIQSHLSMMKILVTLNRNGVSSWVGRCIPDVLLIF